MLFGPTQGTFLANTLLSMISAWNLSDCGTPKWPATSVSLRSSRQNGEHILWN
jgi:hypothetical protein